MTKKMAKGKEIQADGWINMGFEPRFLNIRPPLRYIRLIGGLRRSFLHGDNESSASVGACQPHDDAEKFANSLDRF